MMGPLKSYEKLAQMIGREYGLAVGNATTGLYCAIQAGELHNTSIAVPYNVCPNVVLAVLFSGNKPIFVDIDNNTNGMDPSQLQLVAEEVKGVIAVHSYGAVCKIAEIRTICSDYSLFLIEDCAQSLGAEFNGELVGHHGSISVFSFGKGKIIDVGHGGVVVTDDPILLKEMTQLTERLDRDSEEKLKRILEFNDLHTMFYNRFFDDDVSRFSFVFRKLSDEWKGVFLQRFNESYDDLILTQLDKLRKNIDARWKKAEILKSHCKLNGIPFFEPPSGSVFWRFNLYIKKDRGELLRKLLAEKFKVSSWYPSVDQFFYDTGNVKRRGLCADIIGEEILNLWVNGEVSESYCREILRFVVSFVDRSRLEVPIRVEKLISGPDMIGR